MDPTGGCETGDCPPEIGQQRILYGHPEMYDGEMWVRITPGEGAIVEARLLPPVYRPPLDALRNENAFHPKGTPNVDPRKYGYWMDSENGAGNLIWTDGYGEGIDMDPYDDDFKVQEYADTFEAWLRKVGIPDNDGDNPRTSVHPKPKPIPIDTAIGKWYNSQGMDNLTFREGEFGKFKWNRTDTVKYSNDSTSLIERSDWNTIDAYK
jgi:hypothetical protein